MPPLETLALYPLWAMTLAIGFTALRLGNRKARVLALPSLLLGAWVTGLVLLTTPGREALAERIVPLGMLLAGAFVQSAVAIGGGSRKLVVTSWALAGIVAAIGLFAPRLLYGPGAREPGPLFWPIAMASACATVALKRWLWHMVQAAPIAERRVRLALLTANVGAALGGGGIIGLYVTRLAPIALGVPFLLVGITAAGAAVYLAEDRAGRARVAQALVLSTVTAVFSAMALTAFHFALPALAPHIVLHSAAGVIALFVLSLPLDPLRQAMADAIAGLVFREPLATRELAHTIVRERSRREHAERLAEMGKLAAAVAHEIRNPLGVILAEAKLLEREGANPESLDAVKQQVGRAKRFLDDLLRYAKPRPLDMSGVELAEAIASAARNAEKSLGLGTPRVDVVGTCEVEADPHAVLDVFTNLLTNALMATEGQRSPVVVRIARERDAACIHVEDDGPGVPAEIEARLFTAFTTGRGRSAKHPGTGLGLALSANLVEQHGGAIRYERRLEGGARFVVTWPLAPLLLGPTPAHVAIAKNRASDHEG